MTLSNTPQHMEAASSVFCTDADDELSLLARNIFVGREREHKQNRQTRSRASSNILFVFSGHLETGTDEKDGRMDGGETI